MSVFYSLTEWDGIGKQMFTGLDNYRKLFHNNGDGFWRAVKNSLIFAVGSVFIQLPISLILALLLARGVKGEQFYVRVYFIPVLISTVVIGQLWLKIYNPQYGLLNTILNSIGLGRFTGNWLGDTKKSDFCSYRTGTVAVYRLSYAADVRFRPIHIRGGFRGGPY